ETFALTANTSGEGTVDAECDEGSGFGPCGPLSALPYGTQVKLNAEEETGWEFSSWTGDCDSVTAKVCKVEMNADKTVEAIFAQAGQKTLTTAKSGTGSGSFECKTTGSFGACQASYPDGTTITVKAIPDSHSTFVSWAGC